MYCVYSDSFIVFLPCSTGEQVSLPEEWKLMKDSENIKLVQIPNTDQEYTSIVTRFQHDVKNGRYKDRVKFSMDPNKVNVTKVSAFIQNSNSDKGKCIHAKL